MFAAVMMAGIHLEWKWITILCATTIGAIAFVTYVLVSPLILSFEVIVGIHPRLKEEFDELGRGVCRAFFYFFIPVALLWFIPADSSIGTVFMLFLLLALLGMGTLGKIFPAPFVIRRSSVSFLLISMLGVTVLQLFLPSLSTYAKWGLARSASLASPRPKVVPDSQILAIEDWFNHATGGANYFFAEEENSMLALYDAPGMSPKTGQELLPLDDPEKIRQVVARASRMRERIAAETSRREKELRKNEEELRVERETREKRLLKEAGEREIEAKRRKYLSDSTSITPGTELESIAWALDCDDKAVSEALESRMQLPGQIFGVFRPAFYDEGQFDQLWEGKADILGELLPDRRFKGVKLARLRLNRSTNPSLGGLITTTGSLSIKELDFPPRSSSSVDMLEEKGLGHTKEHSEKDLLNKLTEALTQKFR
ncbi:MAG: hypothetical protein EOP84_04430 [Verrucomicrobiaceae bacterium]|nr:MAG: hypothetical protein EOP84_04430 [Verrucomicrobiaceae bacterium]